ncbi:MAG: Ion transport protein [Methanosaeta sp. PtaU1.Bin060]|nr:MAG: Ion transport protein [Methanosaeta sp. PtaU1.Bin060]
MSQISKKRVYEILEATEPEDPAADVVNFLLMLLVVLNVIAVILETVETIYLHYRIAFQYFSDISIAVFTIEYLLRVWSCDVDVKYNGAFAGRLRYALTPLMLIDLMVILPSYIIFAFPQDHRLLRSLRVFWSFRLLKLSRYSESLQTIVDVIKATQRELAMSVFAIVFFMVLSSTIIYFLEHDAQPEGFPSIPATMWWAILIMTTIGTNVYPVTIPGKVIGGLIIVLGVATFALPTSILTSGFVDELSKKRSERASEDLQKKREG